MHIKKIKHIWILNSLYLIFFIFDFSCSLVDCWNSLVFCTCLFFLTLPVSWSCPGRVSLIRGTSLQMRGLLLEDEGWYECRILPLDKTTDETVSNGSWTLLSVTGETHHPTSRPELFIVRKDIQFYQ